jgi:hypothetical protein
MGRLIKITTETTTTTTKWRDENNFLINRQIFTSSFVTTYIYIILDKTKKKFETIFFSSFKSSLLSLLYTYISNTINVATMKNTENSF